MTAIRTENGWVPLWNVSPPTRPSWVDPQKHGRPDIEAWRDEQWAVLKALHFNGSLYGTATDKRTETK